MNVSGIIHLDTKIPLRGSEGHGRAPPCGAKGGFLRWVLDDVAETVLTCTILGQPWMGNLILLRYK